MRRAIAKEYEEIKWEGGEGGPIISGGGDPDDWRYLGAHTRDGRTYASHYIGQVWLNEGDILAVSPKIAKVSPVRMYSECLRHSEVAAHLDEVLRFPNDEQPEIETSEDVFQACEIIPLIAVAYLRSVYQLCSRHLRMNFTMVEANLVGRVRGRPIVHRQIRANSARGRDDRMYCRFHVGSLDHPLNQIIRAALEQGRKYLNQLSLMDDWLCRMMGFCTSALMEVTLRRIDPREFRGIILGPHLEPYREPLRLARLILQVLGHDPNEAPSTDDRVISIPPFAIDMNVLFERYCEHLLRCDDSSWVWAGHDADDLGKDFRVRPDFLVVRKGKDDDTVDAKNRKGQSENTGSSSTKPVCYIVDAKYKEGWSGQGEQRSDVYQVMTYALHQEVLDKLSKQTGTPEPNRKVVILYPDSETTDKGCARVELEKSEADFPDDFKSIPLFRHAVPLPRARAPSSA